MESIRLVFGLIFLFAGLVFFIIEIIGVYKLNYVLNRMHAAALGDALGLSLSMIGLIILSGFNFVSLKFILVMVFMWFTSPCASHLISKLEVDTTSETEEYRKEER